MIHFSKILFESILCSYGTVSALIRKGSNRLCILFFVVVPCSSVHCSNLFFWWESEHYHPYSIPCSSLLSISVACDQVLVIDTEGSKIIFYLVTTEIV